MSIQDTPTVYPGADVVNPPRWTPWPHAHHDEIVASLRKTHGVVPDWAIPSDILWLVSLRSPEMLTIENCASRWGRTYAAARMWLVHVIGRLPAFQAAQAQGGAQ